MYPSTFDAFAQALTANRRRTLSGLLAGILSFTGWTNTGDAATTGACRPRCGPCRRCRRGKCRQTNQGRRCRRGRCRPRRNGVACGEDRICLNGNCRLRCGAGGPCYVFITSSSHSGDLGGLSGADAICQNLAEAAGLPGIYKAWLSDPENWPASTFLNTAATGPYLLVDGTVIASDWADLTDGTIGDPIDVTERGVTVEESFVWSDTRADGTLADPDNHCDLWSSGSRSEGASMGNSEAFDDRWSWAHLVACDGTFGDIPHRLYCFEQG